MCVLACPADAKLDVGDALQPTRDRRAARGVLVARLPDAAIGPKTTGVTGDECGEVRGPALLLALVEHSYPKWELADRRAIGLDRLQPRDQIALVVGHAPAEEKAVALGRLEGRRGPLVQRIGRLDVVVVVDEQRALAAAGLADDRRRPAVDGQRFRGDSTALLRSVQDDPRGLRNADALRRDGRLADEDFELIDVLAFARAHESIELREAGHAPKVSLRLERSSFGSCSCRARTAASTA